jgi:hypothetical protein
MRLRQIGLQGGRDFQKRGLSFISSSESFLWVEDCVVNKITHIIREEERSVNKDVIQHMETKGKRGRESSGKAEEEKIRATENMQRAIQNKELRSHEQGGDTVEWEGVEGVKERGEKIRYIHTRVETQPNHLMYQGKKRGVLPTVVTMVITGVVTGVVTGRCNGGGNGRAKGGGRCDIMSQKNDQL